MQVNKTLEELEFEADHLETLTDETPLRYNIASTNSDITYHKDKLNTLNDELEELEYELEELLEVKEYNLERLKKVNKSISLIKGNDKLDNYF